LSVRVVHVLEIGICDFERFFSHPAPAHQMSKKNDVLSNRLSNAVQEREEILAAAKQAKQAIIDSNKTYIGIDKFAPMTTPTIVESELKRQTMGLVRLEDFQRIRDELADDAERKLKEEAGVKSIVEKEKRKAEKDRKRKGKMVMSFDDDEEEHTGMWVSISLSLSIADDDVNVSDRMGLHLFSHSCTMKTIIFFLRRFHSYDRCLTLYRYL
jgi:hypothetical protein